MWPIPENRPGGAGRYPAPIARKEQNGHCCPSCDAAYEEKEGFLTDLHRIGRSPRNGLEDPPTGPIASNTVPNIPAEPNILSWPDPQIRPGGPADRTDCQQDFMDPFHEILGSPSWPDPQIRPGGPADGSDCWYFGYLRLDPKGIQ